MDGQLSLFISFLFPSIWFGRSYKNSALPGKTRQKPNNHHFLYGLQQPTHYLKTSSFALEPLMVESWCNQLNNFSAFLCTLTLYTFKYKYEYKYKCRYVKMNNIENRKVNCGVNNAVPCLRMIVVIIIACL